MDSIEIDFLLGLIGVGLFVFRNPQKKFLYAIGCAVMGLFISQYVYVIYTGALVGQIVWIASASGLLLLYCIRLKDRVSFLAFDILKIFSIVLLIIYPLPFYSFGLVGDGEFWNVLRLMTFSIITAIFVYDRWVLKPDIMKRRFIIVLVVQTFLILTMLMYAIVQKSEAEKQFQRAEAERIQAEKNAATALKLQQELENAR